MKKLLFAALVAVSSFVSAQNIDFGLKGGLVFNSDKGELFSNIEQIYNNKGKGSTGFQAGALARISLVGLYIQPELLYTQFKNEYNIEGYTIDVKKNRIDVPVAVGKKILGIGHIQAGPVFSYYFDDKFSVDDYIKAKQDQFNLGLHVGAGVQVSKLMFDLRYEFGLGKISSEYVNDKDYKFNTNNTPKLINLSVAYLF